MMEEDNLVDLAAVRESSAKETDAQVKSSSDPQMFVQDTPESKFTRMVEGLFVLGIIGVLLVFSAAAILQLSL